RYQGTGALRVVHEHDAPERDLPDEQGERRRRTVHCSYHSRLSSAVPPAGHHPSRDPRTTADMEALPMAHPIQTPDTDAAREMVADGCLTIPEALRLAGCGRTMLYGAIQRGELPTVHHGRRTTIPRRALIDWLAQRLRVASGDAA
ncbi:MAG: helix-turn-helix domain-containing protein, partial [bacterium]